MQIWAFYWGVNLPNTIALARDANWKKLWFGIFFHKYKAKSLSIDCDKFWINLLKYFDILSELVIYGETVFVLGLKQDNIRTLTIVEATILCNRKRGLQLVPCQYPNSYTRLSKVFESLIHIFLQFVIYSRDAYEL